jgi:hypothetical protein
MKENNAARQREIIFRYLRLNLTSVRVEYGNSFRPPTLGY